uniref:Uncharacterized protein n=1 Tax=Rhizophora mucronata TaxID=61149 RepID=A0A2P2N4H5_RHIMU
MQITETSGQQLHGFCQVEQIMQSRTIGILL